MGSLRHICCLGLIGIMPFGYYAGHRDSSTVRFDIGAGTGEYATILRSCSDIEGKGTGELSDFGRFGRSTLSLREGSSHGVTERAVSLRWSWPIQ